MAEQNDKQACQDAGAHDVAIYLRLVSLWACWYLYKHRRQFA